MASISKDILQIIGRAPGPVDTRQIAVELDEPHQRVVGAVKSLQSLGNIIEVKQEAFSEYQLTPEGKEILKNGSYEVIIFSAIRSKSLVRREELVEACGLNEAQFKIGLNKAVQNGWIKVLMKEGLPNVQRLVDEVQDETKALLKGIAENGLNVLDDSAGVLELKRRKLITMASQTYFIVRKGKRFDEKLVEGIEKQESDITAELMVNKEYEKRTFKPYNFDAMGVSISSGHLHPIQKMRTEFLTILTEMGFSEMPTNRFVESSFWNFDTLFVPQKHPARDAQDTFFLSEPINCRSLPEDYLEKIKKVHSVGDYGSEGYGSVWKRDEAVKNVLRTHTTAVSARVLYDHAQQPGPFKPIKKFSIDRVFRNETLDATHLAEFHQVEGFVADVNLSLGHLIGIMKEFFGRLGISQLKFKPAYNPYTEPSLEVFAFHPGLKKWVEVGNSGVFRPEMLRPMDFPEDVTVIAWGLSLERPTMIKYGIDNIRDLVGHKVDLRMVYNNGLCRLNKH